MRCPDVQLRADDAVLLAGIIRALVATALAEETAGMPPAPAGDPEVLQVANRHAARYGLSGTLVGPDGRPRSSGDALCALMRHITPTLEDAGDLREVSALSHRLHWLRAPSDHASTLSILPHECGAGIGAGAGRTPAAPAFSPPLSCRRP
ncbi:hypothetical protein [Streptomyces sp. TBY4]|uniref:hypothetical protein n=1 Tax=Streptomyces sp. TBY4 TaxID=2962030 RepID=UPI0027E59D05|nr:hypothetical protein [Streptomyces sp. TBY4]